MSKPFIVLLSIALALGIGLGGAFAGGVALGKSSGTEPQANSIGGPAGNFSQQSGQFGQAAGNFSQQSGQFGQGPGGQFQRRSGQEHEEGSVTQGELTQGSHPGDGSTQDFGQNFEGRNPVSGTIESIDGESIIIKTSHGETTVSVTEDTTINKIAKVSIGELQVGDQVTVIGPVDESGNIAAATIMINPEGLGGSFGGGQFRQRGSRRGQDRP